MGRWGNFVENARRGPANIRFRELCGLVERLGYVLDRRKGSHWIYRHPSRRDLPLINLQKGEAGKAKPYQVRQVLRILEDYGLRVQE